MSSLEIDYKKYFEGKRITKQGFGFLGRGANVVKFLLENGASVLVTDMKSEKDLTQSILELEDFILDNYKVNTENFLDKNGNKRVEYIFGDHRLQDFEKLKISEDGKVSGCDYVIQASGVAKDNIYLKHAKESGVKVYQESSLFVDIVREYNNNLENENKNENEYENRKIKIIGVTGTRGKTTTTFLAKHILDKYLEKENLKNGLENPENGKLNRKAYFGGNVQGVATLENLKYLKGGDVMVMELDSWILQGFADMKYSPNISVFTNIMPDHMNYYKGDMRDYFHDKAGIFLNQKSEKNDTDIFISTENIMLSMEKYLSDDELKDFYNNGNKKVFLNENQVQEINNNFKSNLLGEHNKINVALAVTACAEFMRVEDVSEEGIKIIIQETLNSFTGVAGRLEKIKTIDGVGYINDTCATTGDAGIAALESFSTKENSKNIILITGGRDKELDMINYANKIIELKNNYNQNKTGIKKIILLNDETTTGTKKLIEIFEKNNFGEKNYIYVKSLEEGVWAARSAAQVGDIVLFTPAFASFGMFQNEYDRGDKFVKITLNMV